jgi:NADH dehydrogenase
MHRRIAIVGANGFVGRHLVEHAVRHGTEVLGVVRSTRGAELVRSLGGRPIRLADLGREQTRALAGELADCEGLVYTASVTASPRSADRTDPAGLVNVLGACREAGIPRVVFFSGLGVAHYGMNPYCTNPYFLAKMAGEVALFRSGVAATVFRPSYIFGAGDEFLTPLVGRIAAGSALEIPGPGDYRLQPISVHDTVRAIMGGLEPGDTSTRVVDLVGPEVIAYKALIARLASALSRPVEIRERPLDEALAEARTSGYLGMGAHDLACLLCDEVADSSAVEGLIGGKLESLDSMIAQASATLASSGGR